MLASAPVMANCSQSALARALHTHSQGHTETHTCLCSQFVRARAYVNSMFAHPLWAEETGAGGQDSSSGRSRPGHHSEEGTGEGDSVGETAGGIYFSGGHAGGPGQARTCAYQQPVGEATYSSYC